NLKPFLRRKLSQYLAVKISSMVRSREKNRHRRSQRDDPREQREGGGRRKRIQSRDDEKERASRPREEPLRATGRPKQTSALNRLLAGIGAPEPAPFQPDPFQLEALAALEYEDVLVTAP